MATYYSDALKGSGNAAALTGVGHGAGNDLKVLKATVTGSAAFTTADTLNFFKVPKGFRVVDAWIKGTDQDSSTGITINIGDASSATRFFSASTVGQAATHARMSAVGGFDYKYTADTMIVGALQANASGTAAAGSFTLCLMGYIEGVAS